MGYGLTSEGEWAESVFRAHTGVRVAPVDETLDWSGGVTTITYLQDQLGFDLCFPDEYERGAWSVTNGRAEFSFSAFSKDGSVFKSYALVLTGESFQPDWPVPEAKNSHFMATNWSLTPQGKGKKDPGCKGNGTLTPSIEVVVQHRAPATVSLVDGFLISPLTVEGVPFQLFDHTAGGDGQAMNYEGIVGGNWDGHHAYDWTMDVGTTIVAWADGTVIYTGLVPPYRCGSGIVDDGRIVMIEHETIEGQHFATEYNILQSSAVEYGASVVAGQKIGESGVSGCGTTPRLHFVVRVENPTGIGPYSRFWAKTDPYGWKGSEEWPDDPWPSEPLGVFNQNLWEGEAPPIN